METMITTPAETCLLGLPDELLTLIMNHVFVPQQPGIQSDAVGEDGTGHPTNTNFCLDTTMLRVSKHLHQKARDHLHSALPWVRITINSDKLLFGDLDGIPHHIVKGRDTEDIVSLSHHHAAETVQDVPLGAMSVNITFPPPSCESQILTQDEDALVSAGVRTILISRDDLAIFLSVLRLNDLAYCRRILPDYDDRETFNDRAPKCGLPIRIQINYIRDRKLNEIAMLTAFKPFSGPLGKITVSGYSNSDSVRKLTDELHGTVEVRDPHRNPSSRNLPGRLVPCYEAIARIMELKRRGDEVLGCADDLQGEAFVCYQEATNMATWGKELYDLHMAACSCSAAIAYLIGDLGRLPNSDIAYLTGDLGHYPNSDGGRSAPEDAAFPKHLISSMARIFQLIDCAISPRRFLELHYVVTLMQMIELKARLWQDDGTALEGLRSCLDSLDQTWNTVYTNASDEDGRTIMGRIHSLACSLFSDPLLSATGTRNSAAAPVQPEIRAARVHQTINAMRNLIRGTGIAPVQFHVSRRHIPVELEERFKGFMGASVWEFQKPDRPTFTTGSTLPYFEVSEWTDFPAWDPPTDQELQSGRTHERYML